MHTFLLACLKFFGCLPGQGKREFAAEVRRLTAADRAELSPLLAAALGEPVSSEMAAAPAKWAGGSPS